MDAINGSVGDDELFGEGNDDTIYGSSSPALPFIVSLPSPP